MPFGILLSISHTKHVLGTVPKQNTLIAERREPSGSVKPECLRTSATIEIGNLFRESSLS